MNLNGGYAMIKYNSTQEELQIAYKTKRPVLLYDEDKRAHWAVIEETATESVDEETEETITTYQYSYRLIDEASGGKLYQHVCHVTDEVGNEVYCLELITRDNTPLTLSNLVTILTNRYTRNTKEDFHVISTSDNIYVSRAFVYNDTTLTIRRSTLSNITVISNFDVTVLQNDIISEI